MLNHCLCLFRFLERLSSPRVFLNLRMEIPPEPPDPPDRLAAVRRRGTTLVVRFPVADHFSCTEQGCRATFRAADWTATRRSLERHLERDHQIRMSTISYFCCICNATLGRRPTQHLCGLPTPQALQNVTLHSRLRED